MTTSRFGPPPKELGSSQPPVSADHAGNDEESPALPLGDDYREIITADPNSLHSRPVAERGAKKGRIFARGAGGSGALITTLSTLTFVISLLLLVMVLYGGWRLAGLGWTHLRPEIESYGFLATRHCLAESTPDPLLGDLWSLIHKGTVGQHLRGALASAENTESAQVQGLRFSHPGGTTVIARDPANPGLILFAAIRFSEARPFCAVAGDLGLPPGTYHVTRKGKVSGPLPEDISIAVDKRVVQEIRLLPSP